MCGRKESFSEVLDSCCTSSYISSQTFFHMSTFVA